MVCGDFGGGLDWKKNECIFGKIRQKLEKRQFEFTRFSF